MSYLKLFIFSCSLFQSTLIWSLESDLEEAHEVRGSAARYPALWLVEMNLSRVEWGNEEAQAGFDRVDQRQNRFLLSWALPSFLSDLHLSLVQTASKQFKIHECHVFMRLHQLISICHRSGNADELTPTVRTSNTLTQIIQCFHGNNEWHLLILPW